jgi:hypothetical protein
VCSYERLLDDAVGWAQAAKEFAVQQGVELCLGGSPDRAARFVETALTHHREVRDGPALSDEQAALMNSLTKLHGQHQHFEADVPPLTAATERLFAEQRKQLYGRADGCETHALQTSGIKLLQTNRSVSDRSPSISIVIAPRYRGRLLDSTLEAVLETAPESSEVLVVGESGSVRDSRVTVLERPSDHDRVAAVAVGCEQASGDVVVLCDGGVRPNPGWANVFREALKRSDVGVVGPALLCGGGKSVYGLTLKTACLNVDWMTVNPATEPFEVAVVPGKMMGFRREVLKAVGGFDPGMTGIGGEDTELCIRLWRAGYVCLNVPSASAAVQFDQDTDERSDPTGFLHNRLRLGALHLSPPRVRRLLEASRGDPHFAEAFARVVISDIGGRRALIDAISCFDDGWFLRRFNVAAFEDELERV